MYERKSRLSDWKRGRLIEHFVAGTTARAAAELVGVHRNTAASFYTRLRKVIAEEMEKASPFAGEIEVDESYFGGRRKGKRGRGAGGKVPVFGLLKRGGKVYTAMIPNARTATLMPIMERMIRPDSIVYTDGFSSYDALDVSDFHHVRINHSERFVDERSHINGIENFWNQAKRHLRRFNGVPKQSFHLFLKECEWRFNGGDHRELLNQLKTWIIQYGSGQPVHQPRLHRRAQEREHFETETPLARTARHSIRIRAASSPASTSPACSRTRASASPWTVGAAAWTTSSSSACGGLSSMRRSTYTSSPTASTPNGSSASGSASTTPSGPIRPSTVKRRPRPTGPVNLWI